MKNQQKANFLIVVFVLIMHVLLFWAVFKGQHIEYDDNLSLDYVDLGVDGTSAGSDDTPATSFSSLPPPKVSHPIKKATPERTYIKPVVATKKVSHFQTQQTTTKTPPVITKPRQEESSKEANSSGNQESKGNTKDQGSKDGNSGNKDNNGKGSQEGGKGPSEKGIKVPEEYKGNYLPGLRPTYPPDSIAAGEKGVVGISVSVSAEGIPLNVKVVKSSGFGRLDRSATIAVKRHRFKPATRNGVAIPYSYTFNVNFSFKS